MSTTSLATPAAARASAGLGALLAAVVACTVIGAVLAVRLLSGGSGHTETTASGPFGVAQDIPTSFGFVAVEHAETVKGLTARQLGGATHGIGTFVGRDKALVQASVTLTNTTPRTVRYDPRQFVLVTRDKKGKERRVAASYASIKAGVLQPDAAIDARVSYVVPRDGSRVVLTFADPARKEPIVVDLKRGAGRVSAQDRRELRNAHRTHAG